MAGVDARTGKPLDGIEHVQQSLDKIITTALAERVMREWVGNPGLKLLGENGVETVILRWVTIVWALVELFEPRVRLRRFEPVEITRLGLFDLVMVLEHRPYAHLDWEQARFFISVRDGVVTLSPGG